MAWEFQSGIPIYQQIITALKTQIASGKYRPDEKLPSVRDLAMEAGVNPNTMQRALSRMEQDGFLYTNRTAGRFVASDPAVVETLRRQIAEEEIGRLYARLQEIGMAPDEIAALVNAWTCKE